MLLGVWISCLARSVAVASTKPRAIEVRWDPNSGAVMERRPVRQVPLVGDVAAGTDVLAEENVEELLPLPADFTGEGDLFIRSSRACLQPRIPARSGSDPRLLQSTEDRYWDEGRAKVRGS